VGGPDVIRITTSRRQGQVREDWSEGSPSAKVRADEQKSHRRLSLRASWHHTTKPKGPADRVNAAVVQRAHVLIRGDLSDVAVMAVAQVPAGPTGRQRSRRRRGCRFRRAQQAVEPQPAQRAAQRCVRVIGQKSAEAIVVAEVFTRGPSDEGPNMDTRRSRGQLVHGAEPDRVSHLPALGHATSLVCALTPSSPSGVYRMFMNRSVRTRMPGGVGGAS
jgi:hypothetical protein